MPFVKSFGDTIYYKITGWGKPLVLLHGNGGDHTKFDALISRLSIHWECYAFDSPAHGLSSEPEALHYDSMMESIAEALRIAGLEKPAVLGFSDGAIIGLMMAIKYPQLVSALIAAGANTIPDGVSPRFRRMAKRDYNRAPESKLALLLNEPHIPLSSLAEIKAPTLLLTGSRDIIPLAHTKAIARHIQGSKMAVLNGESHSSYIHNGRALHYIVPFLESLSYI
ncbi:MAG: alpha/beta hydrolase [Eubacteriaceae bacterium]|nr:alpha/beta hydrolase [Eubacteriaceae bacterium]